jgi:transcriptional regulator with XRE-family HTH domain
MNITDRITKLVLARRPDIGPRGVKRAIASACGISYEAVRQWYAGDTGNIKNENLVAVAEKFDTTVDWLLSGDGDPPCKTSAAPARPAQAEPDQGAAEVAHHADMLAMAATPRSREILRRIAMAADEGRLTEDDLDLLDQIAARFESRQPDVSTTPATPHQRLREKLKRND